MNINLDKALFNDAYFPYVKNTDRYLIIYGGAGSGKSFFIVQRYVYLLLKHKKRNLLVIRRTALSNRDSTYALFKRVISQWGLTRLFKFNESTMRITFPTGCEVVFKGLDDSEKLKSITFPTGELTDIWIEEATEIQKKDFNQLDLRLRGKGAKKQMVLSFNPVFVNHWIKTDIIDKKMAAVIKTTYKDNKFLDEDYKRVLESYKESDPYYYSVYCLGNWGVTGESVFNEEKIQQRLNEKHPFEEGTFKFSYDLLNISDIEFVKGTGNVKIYYPPKRNTPYIIGADTAGEGSDEFVAQVLDAKTLMQVGVFSLPDKEDEFARILYCLGKFYNDALIAVECNFSTYISMELSRLSYQNQYVREKVDTATRQKQRSFGFITSSANRPVMISLLKKAFNENCEIVNDKTTLFQMQSFVKDKNGKAQASVGAHDDYVMALAIAHFAREQALERFTTFEEKKEKNFNFTAEKDNYLRSEKERVIV